jgi:hypothetical protein
MSATANGNRLNRYRHAVDLIGNSGFDVTYDGSPGLAPA